MGAFSALSHRIGVKLERHSQRGEAGQGLAEYALVLALVALASVAAVGALGSALASSSVWRIFG
jgi:Flp pilus assembly pilin Flp